MNIFRKIKFVPDFLKGYSFSDPIRNGEFKFLRNYIKTGMTIFDVGANIGEYTKYLLSLDSSLNIHCFEPVKETYEQLKENFEDLLNEKVYYNNFGLSNEKKNEEIFVYGKLAGSNSIYFNEHALEPSKKVSKQTVSLNTLDKYVLDKNITRIDLLKIDVEGHEFNVLSGALNLLKSNMIYCIQFEYGEYWKFSGNKLINCFDLLEMYNIYRLTPWGKIKIKRFTKNLENYKYSNYIAILKDKKI